MRRQKQQNVSRINSSYMKKYDAHVERQRKKKKRLHRRLTLFAIVVCITFGSIITYHMNQRSLYAKKNEEYQTLQEEYKVLQQEEKDLTEKVKLLKDEEYVLQIAKTNYFFTKEGEIVFKLPEEAPSY
ncbi:Cell division protein DivIC [Paraliobacillus sp. PM-2]|uniref:FtsB family cell division protein n=1 Tax=Paraliobacillus sp. PM-2 TaxID=1462524 RepID=UPI00061CB560|nr:septum formation initiator family protein [Paraliobacillus sp. PM-2]CQR47470.1 Cell division protein DivIC [Paraliobacillus sp. PM-2]